MILPIEDFALRRRLSHRDGKDSVSPAGLWRESLRAVRVTRPVTAVEWQEMVSYWATAVRRQDAERTVRMMCALYGCPWPMLTILSHAACTLKEQLYYWDCESDEIN